MIRACEIENRRSLHLGGSSQPDLDATAGGEFMP
jgi:hypothetical protein